MTIDMIKNELNEYIGKEINIKYSLGRNKFEKYNVVLKELYDYIFLVENECGIVKSFTYSDVITKTIYLIRINHEP